MENITIREVKVYTLGGVDITVDGDSRIISVRVSGTRSDYNLDNIIAGMIEIGIPTVDIVIAVNYITSITGIVSAEYARRNAIITQGSSILGAPPMYPNSAHAFNPVYPYGARYAQYSFATP